MTLLIFLLVLVVLIVVHELGHFFAAKWSGMRVEEFGLGYPPHALTLATHNGTQYTLNWLPFGGFVRIYGEDGEGATSDSFVAKPHWVQALTLFAGILMNIVFAWVLISVCLGLGMQQELSSDQVMLAPDAHLVVSKVLEGSPAAEAGLKAGDTIAHADAGNDTFAGGSAESFTSFVAKHPGELVTFVVERGEELVTLTAVPVKGAIASDPSRAALGVGVASVGTLKSSWLDAPIEGAQLTWSLTKEVAKGLVGFFASIFTFTADLSQVSGPVGIAGAVGDASHSGLVPLLTLTAVISLNLALINLLPLPALDGGRLLFVLIEAITRRKIPEKVASAVNALGFSLLILLMLAVTASDIFKLL